MRSDESGRQSFTYGYMTFRCEAALDADELTVKQGLRTFRVAIPKLRFLFVRSSTSSPQQSLVLAEERTGKRNKIHRFFANAGDPQFLALIDAIIDLRPDIDLRGLDEKTALKKMGATNTDFIVLVLAMPLIVAIALLPRAIHGFDFTEDRISIASLAKGKQPDSRNIIITGARARLAESIEVTTTRTKRGVDTGSTTKYLVPIVQPDWDKSQPVRVILETDEMTSADEEKLERATKFTGIVRNVLWEGLDRGDREYLTREAGLALHDDVLLVEYRANPRFDLLVFLAATGMTLFIMLVAALAIWLKRRRG